MYSKLHDVCDVKTFETLCFGKVLFGKKLFIPKRSLRENFKILLIVNNSYPVFCSPYFLCKSVFWIFSNMKREKKPPKVTWPYILIKERKTHEILFATLEKTSQTLNVARYSKL